ncbi:hypothetical protein [Saccharibacter floricola]|uniref:Uncharacterized protein n=1 Tax=Saccharibacter floricola DSM 15669 TaxID=1123227 RepID=A0ABQ0P140_9PROT|nr:hypothetical protein [Saccharibacter floricola]GBQ08802.1 hypothetical protein AA15669_1915 [Saccharibacter floricola DSM 15669]
MFVKHIVKIVWSLLFLHASVAYATGEGVPAQGERMIHEAAQDLSRRYKEGQWAYDSAVDLRRCIDERVMRHKAVERYDAQRCFIEWRTIQNDILDEALGRNHFLSKPNSPTPLTALGDIIVFDSKSERVWATVDAPQRIMNIFLMLNGIKSVRTESISHNTDDEINLNKYIVAPPHAPEMIEKASDNIIKNIVRKVTPLDEKNMGCDYDEEEDKVDGIKEEKYSMRLHAYWYHVNSKIMNSKTDNKRKDIYFLEIAFLRNQIPSSYDWYIRENVDYNKSHFFHVPITCFSCGESDFSFIKTYIVPLSSPEIEWAETRGAEEVWKRVQDKLRWN